MFVGTTEQVDFVLQGFPRTNRCRAFARTEHKSWEGFPGWHRRTRRDAIWYSGSLAGCFAFHGRSPNQLSASLLLLFVAPSRYCSLGTLHEAIASFRCCSFPRALFALLPSSFASGHRLRSQQPRPFAASFWDRTIAFFGPLILIVIVSLFSLLFALFPRLS